MTTSDLARTLCGSGSSTSTDAATAGREAVEVALAGRVPQAGDLVVLFASVSYDVEALHGAAVAAAAPAEVVGCSTCGAFTESAQVPDGCVASFLPADGASFGVCHVDRTDDDTAGSARRAAQTAQERAGADRGHAVLLLLSEGIAPDQRAVVRGAYEVTSALVPIVGGVAGDDLRMERTFTFGEGRVSTNGIVTVWINSPRPLGVSVDHGWRPHGRPMLVTRAQGNVIHEIDGRPAVEVYFAESGIADDGGAFISTVLERPIGLPNAQGRYEVRQMVDRLADGGLVFNTGMPDQTVIQVMGTDADALLAGARRATTSAIAQLDGPPRGALVFSCASRVPLMGHRIAEEVAAISEGLEGVQACGFFTIGEFARVTGSTGVHNSSVAVLAL